MMKLLAKLQSAYRQESGQVLVLFAAGAVAFVGMLALAIDVGNLYLERRHAQAVADAAALVAAQNAQSIIPNVTINQPAAVKDARDYAVKNGYNTNPSASNHTWHGEVRVDCPPQSGPNQGKLDYVEVQIRRTMTPLFGGVFGANTEVYARAVARAKHSRLDAATISLYEGDASTVNIGSGSTNVIGGTYSRGVTKGQTGSLVVVGKAYALGGFQGTAINPTEGFVGSPYSAPPPELFDPKWTAPVANPLPGVYWDSTGPVERATKDVNGWLHIYPGTYKYIKIAAGDKVIFHPGVYSITAAQGITNNGSIHGNGVCFVMASKADFSSQSQGEVHLSSSPDYNNILIWSADCANDAVKIAGGNSVTIYGTIYAPCGAVHVAGNATGLVHGQVVANNIIFEGTSGTAVVYDPAYAAEIPGPALVE